MEHKAPQEYHPDLTKERLIAIARAFAQGRANAVSHHLPEVGDNGWTLGCRAFTCSQKEIKDLSLQKNWLSIEDPSLHFVFKIGEANVRFYRGEPDKPNPRTLQRKNYEVLQWGFDFSEGVQNIVFLISIDTDAEGYADNIYLVCCRGETVIGNWKIPYKEGAVSIPPVTEDIAKSEGVELPPAPIGIPGEKKTQDDAS